MVILTLCIKPFLGHLYVKSDVYGFGVVMLEMLSGQRALDPNRPNGQLSLVDWAKPYLADRRKLARLMDPRFEGQYNSKQALQAAQLTLNCLAGEPRSRPSMKEVIETLEKIESTKSRAREARGSDSARDRQHGLSTVHQRSSPHSEARRGSRANGHATKARWSWQWSWWQFFLYMALIFAWYILEYVMTADVVVVTAAVVMRWISVPVMMTVKLATKEGWL
jgi:hypothetical protein